MILALAGVGKNIKSAVVGRAMKERPPVIPGFLFSGLAAGIKKKGRKDIGLIFSETPAAAAGVFTRNWVKAAPVVLTQKRLERGYLQAVIANSGCANACTGKRGMEDAGVLTKSAARTLGISPDLVVMASTGVIGEFLPTRKMRDHLAHLCREMSEEKINDFAQAIITTDTVTKIAFRARSIDGKTIALGGVAKGAGMINPSLATMLVFIFTNAAVSPKTLQALLTKGVGETFNRITVDGDTSTNDTVILLANGEARNRPFSKRTAARNGFTPMLFEVMEELARKIIFDGEGATKIAEIRVQKARSRSEAEDITRSIACSPLVKTSFYGEEANWGRIISAAGKTRFPISFEKVDLFVNRVPLVRKGRVLGRRNERRAQIEMGNRNFSITLVLNQGKYEFSMLTTDFSPEYVTINAGYKS
jgi:glutamate N-acetyltransferase/amino-acid N-acetyltransferase